MARQFLIAVDQVINTLVWLPGDGFGMADETLSARAWRMRHQHPWMMRAIDAIFFWESNHCMNAYVSEVFRRHLPDEFRGKSGCGAERAAADSHLDRL